jgi:hypothetical protein
MCTIHRMNYWDELSADVQSRINKLTFAVSFSWFLFHFLRLTMLCPLTRQPGMAPSLRSKWPHVGVWAISVDMPP